MNRLDFQPHWEYNLYHQRMIERHSQIMTQLGNRTRDHIGEEIRIRLMQEVGNRIWSQVAVRVRNPLRAYLEGEL
jgi:hypothetical protein